MNFNVPSFVNDGLPTSVNDIMLAPVNVVDNIVSESVVSEEKVVISESNKEWYQNPKSESNIRFDSDLTYAAKEERHDGSDSDKLSSHEERYDVVYLMGGLN